LSKLNGEISDLEERRRCEREPRTPMATVNEAAEEEVREITLVRKVGCLFVCVFLGVGARNTSGKWFRV
jgi:hypothetical protein